MLTRGLALALGLLLAVSATAVAATGEAPASATTRLVVRLTEGGALDDRAVGGAPVIDEERLHAAGLVVLEVPTSAASLAAAALRHAPQVASVTVDTPVAATRIPNDPRFREQAGFEAARIPAAWNVTTGASDVVVAVLDTGVSRHTELEGALLTGWNVVDPALPPVDDSADQHGTQVAGIVAARGDNGRGIAGVCWRCRVMPVKVLDEFGQGWTSWIIEGIYRAVSGGADVINLSLGGPVDDPELRRAVAAANAAGVVVVAAAGNQGVTSPTYPAAYPEVLGVAGVDATGHRYSWSNHGSWVSVAAAGCNLSTFGSTGYEQFCGTSSASPLVAGTAALLTARGVAEADIRYLLQRTARELPAPAPAAWGELDAERPFVWLRDGTAVRGDWNGDGVQTPGWFKDGEWLLTDTVRRGPASHRFTYGRASDLPLVGDWDGDGDDDIGIVRDGGEWHLRLALAGGRADLTFTYGRVGRRGSDLPLVGDWDGDGRDTIGIVRDGEWHLRDRLAGGVADRRFTYGRVTRGDLPLVGDWDGDGRDTIGIVRDGEWHLRDRLAGGAADRRFTYGRVTRGDRPLIGDWDGDGVDTPAIVRRHDWLLRNRLAGGQAEVAFPYGG